jgi:hypothetical protein
MVSTEASRLERWVDSLAAEAAGDAQHPDQFGTGRGAGDA